MKQSLAIAGIFLVAGTVSIHAQGRKQKNESYQPGVVVTVQKYQPASLYYGSPTDAPLRATEYDYDIGIRVNCNVYLGRYQSAIPYLPSSFVPNHSVEVLEHKHILYVSMPEIGRKVKMGIVGHKRIKNDGCRPKG